MEREGVGPGCWDEGEIWRMMNAGEENMKKRMLMKRTKYFVLKEVLKYHGPDLAILAITMEESSSRWWTTSDFGLCLSKRH